MARQTKFIMVVSIFKVQVTTKLMITITDVNICHNHAILYTSHDNSNPLSIQTHSKVHYL